MRKLKLSKILFIVIFAFCGIINAFPLSTSYWLDGYWSDWRFESLALQGEKDEFVIYEKGDHPSIFIFKVKMSNYSTPTKKEKKEHLKNNKSFEYSGAVEYWVSEKYPSIKDALKHSGKPVSNPDRRYSDKNSGVKVKRTANAKIRFKFDKNGEPYLITLFFDGVGYAASRD